MAEKAYAPVGTTKLFENDRCVVWELRLEPGQAEEQHKHTRDYVLVILEGDRIAAHFDKNSTGGFAAYAGKTYEGDVVPGSVRFIEKGGIEVAENIGTKPYRNIIVEFKD